MNVATIAIGVVDVLLALWATLAAIYLLRYDRTADKQPLWQRGLFWLALLSTVILG